MTTSSRRWVATLAALALPLGMSLCKGSTETKVPTSMAITPRTPSLTSIGATQQFSAVVISKLRTQASVDVYADCVAKAFVPKMHARPNVEEYLKNFNDASVGCGSPH